MLADLYRTLTRLSGPALGWWLRRRARAGREWPERLPERQGIALAPRPPGRLIWLHGASVGEAVSVLPLIDALLARFPDCHVLMTTGTVTSARLMGQRLPPRAIHQFIPLDHPVWVERFLDHWRPDLALWIESELWPNLLGAINARHIPAILLNGRMSERSARGWARAPALARSMLASFSLILAQSTGDADRFARFADRSRIAMPGNLKFSGPALPADETALSALSTAIGERPRWLLASSHPGEEQMAAAVHAALAPTMPDLLTIVVPRHPERGAALTSELGSWPLAKRSNGELPTPDVALYIADTLGELGLFYRLCPLVVMGGSLVPHGGQNPIEPARLGCAILAGPHMQNFRAIALGLESAGALHRVTPENLADTIGRLLRDKTAMAALADAAASAATAEAGVLDRVMAALDPYLKLAAE